MNFTKAVNVAALGLAVLTSVGTVQAKNKKNPNFLFITCEDISPYLNCYGDSTAKTPNLDKLAKESLVYDNAFATVGVCAPSRSSIITGMYPVSIGTHHMRTGKDVTGWGYRRGYEYKPIMIDQEGNEFGHYAVVTPPEVRCFTVFLRQNGYFCTNSSKTDYQFKAPISAWDENGRKAHFKNRTKNQPFFSVFNIGITHESQIWMKAKDSLRVNPQIVPLHSYWPDTDTVRLDMARNYSNIELLDFQVGELLDDLKASGQLENTFVFFFSDHGGPLPRGKRAIYDSGLRTPFMIRFPKGTNKGRTDRLISYVDIAPTVLSLANIEIPAYIQGKAFLGEQEREEREYIFGSADRFDECYDRVRCVRNKNYMLVRNFNTEQSRYLEVNYRKQIPMMNNMLRLRDEGKLNTTQMIWFENTKPDIEFYDVNADPEQVNNIAGLAEHKDKVDEMLNVLTSWQEGVKDKGEIPEAEMIKSQWPNFVQPQTEMPQIKKEAGSFYAEVSTKGADIVYRYSESNKITKKLDHWHIYNGSIEKKKGMFLHVRATRIGYLDSDILVVKM